MYIPNDSASNTSQESGTDFNYSMTLDDHNSIVNLFSATGRVITSIESSQFDILPIHLSELNHTLNRCNNIKIKNSILTLLATVPELIHYIASRNNISGKFIVASKATNRFSTKSTQIFNHSDCNGLPSIIDIRGIDSFCVIERIVKYKFDSTNIQYWDEWLANIALPVMRRVCALLKFDTIKSSEFEWNFELYELSNYTAAPTFDKVSYKATLLTSMFNGEKYLDTFINNLAMSPLFKSINLIIFDANSSDKDLKHIAPYLAKFKNIKYFKLKSDPGLYEIWNLGIHISSTEYVGNANLDDRRHPLQLEALISALDKNNDLDLVSTHVVPMHDYTADIYSFKESAPYIFYSWMEGNYTISDLFKIEGDHIQSNCIPHCMPIWRKRIHEKCGYFNESNNRSAADFELWLRGIDLGLTFSIVPIPASYYYVNPNSYMRCDTGHENIAAHLHSIYISRMNPSPPNYIPDFAYLESLIDFSIN